MGGTMDEHKGRVERAAGELLDDDDLKKRGQVDKLRGKLKDKVDDVADKAHDLIDRHR